VRVRGLNGHVGLLATSQSRYSAHWVGRFELFTNLSKEHSSAGSRYETS
jgi:hypothetical protein